MGKDRDHDELLDLITGSVVGAASDISESNTDSANDSNKDSVDVDKSGVFGKEEEGER